MGLGQSHLSQKIPATTTRCVYLDHLLSRAFNSAKFTTAHGIQQGCSPRLILFQAKSQEVEGPVRAIYLQMPTFTERVQLMARREKGTGSVHQRKDGSWVGQFEGK